MKKAIAVLLLGAIVLFVFFFRKIPPQDNITTTTPTSVATQEVSKGEAPLIPFKLPEGYVVHVFAKGLSTPRDLQFTPQGTLLVSDPSNNRILALPDQNHDGKADKEMTIISNIPQAHGLAFYNGTLFVAGVTGVYRYHWDESGLSATLEKKLFDLPANSNHNNRTLTFDPTGNLYISLGSTCNVCSQSPRIGGSVLLSNSNGDNLDVYATGLRNAAFIAINPKTHEVWGTEMGRDYLGDDTPPDEINIIKKGSNYGWPNCYGNKIPDRSFDGSENCTDTVSPVFQLPAHTAPLGLAFISSPQFPASWQSDLLVALHGSWNRSTAVGYKIVHLKLNGNTVVSSEDFMTGFNPGDTKDDSLGRPVDMVFDNTGNLYISDDKAGEVYIVQNTKSEK